MRVFCNSDPHREPRSFAKAHIRLPESLKRCNTSPSVSTMQFPSWLVWYKKPEYRDIREYATAVGTGKRSISPDGRNKSAIPSRLSLERVLENKTCMLGSYEHWGQRTTRLTRRFRQSHVALRLLYVSQAH